jgi:hypothetical protein
MATTNLNLDTLTGAQSDKVTSLNNATERIDDLLGDVVEVDISASGTVNLSADESERVRVLRLTGTLTSDTTVRFASNTRRTPVILWRDGDNAGFTCEVRNIGTSAAHLVGEVRLLQDDIVEVMKTSNGATEEGVFPTGEPMVYVEGDLVGTGAVIVDPTDPGDNVLFNDADPDTITRASGSFLTENYTAGMLLLWAGTASNDFAYRIEAVVALTLTLISDDAVVAEGSVAATNAGVNEGVQQGTTTEKPLQFLDDQVCFRHVFARARVGFKSGLGGSFALAETGPASAAAFDLRKISRATGADTSVGSIDFAATERAATFTFSADVDFEPGDVLEIRAPDTAEAQLSEVHFVLRGYRH